MRISTSISQFVARPQPRHAQSLIAIGLAIQIAAAWRPEVPVVTGMALVAWGATAATIGRIGSHRLAGVAVMAHLVAYCSLYLLFAGAIWHAATVDPHQGWRFWPTVDLAASIWPIMAALHLGLAVMFRVSQRSDEATPR